MNFDHLQLFRDIALQRSVSKGAQMNGVSQSAASQHISEIEGRLGTPLLDRTTRPLVLTKAGRLYLDMCRDVLRRSEEFHAAIGELKKDVEGRVRVAAIYSVGLSEMTEMEWEFKRRFPEATIEVEYLRPEKIYEIVLAGDADLGLVSYPVPARDLAVIPWRREEMVIACAPSHNLARFAVVKPAELNQAHFIAFDQDLPIRREVDRFLREHSVEVNVVMHFDNIMAIKEAVMVNAGISILPERILAAEVAAGRIVAVPLLPGLVRPLGIIHRRRKTFNRATRSLLELLQQPPRNPVPEPLAVLG